MPKLSDIDIDIKRFRGKGIRPWNDSNVVKPHRKKTISNTLNESLANGERFVSNTLANNAQCASKPLANSEDLVSTALANNTQCVSKPLAEPLATTLADDERYVSNALARGAEIKNVDIVELLVGKEKELLNFLFQKCQLSGSLLSPAITTDELKKTLKINAEHLRNLIYRVLKKRAFGMETIKKGRAGWRKFRLSKEVFQYMSLNQTMSNALANREQCVSNALVKPLAEPLARTSSSSSSIDYINTTTTSVGENTKLDNFNNEWFKIDIAPLWNIGFTKTHIFQIASQNKLSAEAVQDSIYIFAFDLKENNKAKSIKGDPINFFMGILRNGKPYAPPSNYESPQDRALRLYTEGMREVEQRRVAIEKEAFNLAYNEWFIQLNDNQKKEFLPENLRRNVNLEKNKMLEGSARNYFEVKIWPNKKKEIAGKTSVIGKEGMEKNSKANSNFT